MKGLTEIGRGRVDIHDQVGNGPRDIAFEKAGLDTRGRLWKRGHLADRSEPENCVPTISLRLVMRKVADMRCRSRRGSGFSHPRGCLRPMEGSSPAHSGATPARRGRGERDDRAHSRRLPQQRTTLAARGGVRALSPGTGPKPARCSSALCRGALAGRSAQRGGPVSRASRHRLRGRLRDRSALGEAVAPEPSNPTALGPPPVDAPQRVVPDKRSGQPPARGSPLHRSAVWLAPRLQATAEQVRDFGAILRARGPAA